MFHNPRVLPQVKPRRWNPVTSFQVKVGCVAIDWFGAYINAINLNDALADPDAFISTLNEANVRLKEWRQSGSISDQHGNHVFQVTDFVFTLGLHVQKYDGTWERNYDPSYLTLFERDLTNGGNEIAVTNYVSLQKHEDAIDGALSRLDARIIDQVQKGIQNGVSKAIEVNLATANEIASERERLEVERVELEKRIAQLESAEARAREKESLRRVRKTSE